MYIDLVAAFDRFGEAGTAALGALVIGAIFGYSAQRSRFCLRAAVIEFSRGDIGERVSVWLLAFGAAVAGTQLLIASGVIDLSNARQLSATGSLSGALIGGVLFGSGMILTRGCASRLLVLSANGNLRALLSGLVFAVVAQASMRGVLAPAREYLAQLWTVQGGPSRDVLQILGLAPEAGLIFSLLCLAAACYFALRNRLSWIFWLGSLGVGAMVAAGWWFTALLASQAFDPVTLTSLTFTGPSADTLMLFLSPIGSMLGFDVGLVPGVFLGSFLAALLARELKLEGFRDATSMRRYIIGAAMMGFGGMLAGGCAVGAGVTGGAIFALTAWMTLTAIWASAGITYYLVDHSADTPHNELAPVAP
ncbi:MAG: YeeE/YedE family protein [Geminicoccaceae bacterium]